MKIFVCTSGSYSDYNIDAIFSTKGLAEAFTGKARDHKHSYANIEEWEVDAPSDKAWRWRWDVRMKMDGSIDGGNKDGWAEIAELSLRAGKITHHFSAAEPAHSSTFGTHTYKFDARPETEWIDASSYVSRDHAIKLAAEKRQEILRMRAIDPEYGKTKPLYKVEL